MIKENTKWTTSRGLPSRWWSVWQLKLMIQRNPIYKLNSKIKLEISGENKHRNIKRTKKKHHGK